MKTGLCRKIAWENIRKNYRFFIPRILAETGLLACFYIIFTLACDKRLSSVKGGDYLPTFMWMGAVIIGLLSFILLLYTNSFLMKQRKREFGLYSVLGLGKKHICRVLFHESLICTVISIAAGLLGGMLFYKLCSLAICRLLKAEIVAGFYFIKPMTVIPAGAIFLGIDIFDYFINCISIGRMKPVELLSSTSTGEKEPKIKWVLLILGIVTLAWGYYISLTTEDPRDAILLFFAAVLLVIAGTYLLYTAGSIFVLKALKKSDGYYYKPGHITAVSGLLYRMKQNAVGLASVAILATGVLVMTSTTFCLYSRIESTLEKQYPQDFYLPVVFYESMFNPFEIPEDVYTDIVRSCAEKNGLKIKDGFTSEYFDVTFGHKNGQLLCDTLYLSEETDVGSVCDITFISEAMYVSLGGEPLGLSENEVAVCPYNTSVDFGDDSFTLFDKEYTVTKKLYSFPIPSSVSIVNTFGMVVENSAFMDIFESTREIYDPYFCHLERRYCVTFENIDKAFETGDDFAAETMDSLYNYIESAGNTQYSFQWYDASWQAHNNLYGMYGTLLFLGILLGTVCLFATVLIIYYKQISEGYEDRQRYQIMQKIGMTDREVKKTIRSQITLVFFLPLVTAGIHVAFAYPILTKMMKVMLLDNEWLFAKWCLIVYAAFALVYALIYKLTAKTYYKIVY